MKLSKKTLIILGVIAGVLFLATGTLYFLTRPKKTTPPKDIHLTYWGVFDAKEVMDPIITAYTKEHPNVTIEYMQKPIEGYDEALKNAFAAGNGPDIFQIHNTDVPRYQEYIQPLAASETSRINDFFDVVEKDAVLNNQIYGLPLSVDSLVLYYNKRLFQKANIANPPRTWDDFNDAVKKLTQIDSSGNFVQSGAAIGGSLTTINRATDLLSLFWLQQGTTITSYNKDSLVLEDTSQNPAGTAIEKPGLTGLTQYLSYGKPLEPVYTWNESQSYSFDEFSQEKTAMIFSYAYALPTIRSKNPKMQFGIVPAPQVKNSTINIAYANYWLNVPWKDGVSATTAWDFITFATNTENDKLYSSLSNKPVARRDLVNAELNDATLSAFAEQNLYATSWYQFDAAKNEVIMNTLLTSVLTGKKTLEDAYQKALRDLTNVVIEGRQLKEKIVELQKAAAEKEKLQQQQNKK